MGCHVGVAGGSTEPVALLALLQHCHFICRGHETSATVLRALPPVFAFPLLPGGEGGRVTPGVTTLASQGSLLSHLSTIKSQAEKR
eukprot:323317-Pelagomonas_calceolata.AAC.1